MNEGSRLRGIYIQEVDVEYRHRRKDTRTTRNVRNTQKTR